MSAILLADFGIDVLGKVWPSKGPGFRKPSPVGGAGFRITRIAILSAGHSRRPRNWVSGWGTFVVNSGSTIADGRLGENVTTARPHFPPTSEGADNLSAPSGDVRTFRPHDVFLVWVIFPASMLVALLRAGSGMPLARSGSARIGFGHAVGRIGHALSALARFVLLQSGGNSGLIAISLLHKMVEQTNQPSVPVQSAWTFAPASGIADGIHLAYRRAVMVQSLCPNCLATHMTFSPALSAWEAKVWRIW